MLSSRRRSRSFNDDSGFQSQGDSTQAIELIQHVIESNELSTENTNLLSEAKQILEGNEAPSTHDDFATNFGSGVSFDDIIGHQEVKNLLIQSLMLPMRQPQLFGNATPIRNILLYGPPGTGKTMLAKCVASQMNLPFLSVSCSSLLTPYFGESEAKISKLFTTAQNLSEMNQPCVVFFDEIDAVTRKRSETEDEVTRRVKSELLRSIDGISNSSGVFLLGCTNCPWDIDEAFIRRFSRRIPILLPSQESCLELLLKLLSGVELAPVQLQQILSRLNNYSGSDIVTELVLFTVEKLSKANVANTAKNYPMEELVRSNQFHIQDDGSMNPSNGSQTLPIIDCTWEEIPDGMARTRPVSYDDIIRALDSIRPSVSNEMMLKFANFSSL